MWHPKFWKSLVEHQQSCCKRARREFLCILRSQSTLELVKPYQIRGILWRTSPWVWGVQPTQTRKDRIPFGFPLLEPFSRWIIYLLQGPWHQLWSPWQRMTCYSSRERWIALRFCKKTQGRRRWSKTLICLCLQITFGSSAFSFRIKDERYPNFDGKLSLRKDTRFKWQKSEVGNEE